MLSNNESIKPHTFLVKFSDTCTDASFTPTINDLAWTPTTSTFDLLSKTFLKLDNCPFSDITYLPAGCNYNISCKVMRKSDDADMLTLMPEIYNVGA